jgi:hypothetical protein
MLVDINKRLGGIVSYSHEFAAPSKPNNLYCKGRYSNLLIVEEKIKPFTVGLKGRSAEIGHTDEFVQTSMADILYHVDICL